MLLKCANPNVQELSAILTDMNSASQHGAELLANMRQMFRSSAVAMQPLDIRQVVRDVVTLYGGEIRSKKIALSLALQPDLPLVMGDRVHLSQVLLNLLMNGIDAVQSRSPDARRIVVEAHADSAKGEVEVTVRDTGHGIPDDLANKVFTPFFTTREKGPGLGLAFVREIVRDHGGVVNVQEADGGGSVFSFDVPAVPA